MVFSLFYRLISDTYKLVYAYTYILCSPVRVKQSTFWEAQVFLQVFAIVQHQDSHLLWLVRHTHMGAYEMRQLETY